MIYSGTADRRVNRRYLVKGSAVIRNGAQTTETELVNVSAGGMLIFSKGAFSSGEAVNVRFRLADYANDVEVNGRVVHTAGGLLGIGFLEETSELREALLWLEAGFIERLL